MTDARQFLVNHGPPILFGAVFAEQMGLPLPAIPWLLAAGALSASGGAGLGEWLAISTAACLVADFFWFYLGRFRGRRVLKALCRVSLEPDSCVQRTENVFTKYGWRGLIVAKFVPGLSTVAPPLAGMSDISGGRFLLVDSAGSVLYGGCFLLLGWLFSSQIQQIGAAIASIGGQAFALGAGVFAAYVGFKFWKRHRLLVELRMARISVGDLRKMMDAGESVVILDLRSKAEAERDPKGIKGAIWLGLDDVRHGRYDIPHDKEVIVYCSCPNEATAARVALLLRRQGFTNVRPLLGGLDAWREQSAPAANPVTESP